MRERVALSEQLLLLFLQKPNAGKPILNFAECGQRRILVCVGGLVAPRGRSFLLRVKPTAIEYRRREGCPKCPNPDRAWLKEGRCSQTATCRELYVRHECGPSRIQRGVRCDKLLFRSCNVRPATEQCRGDGGRNVRDGKRAQLAPPLHVARRVAQ